MKPKAGASNQPQGLTGKPQGPFLPAPPKVRFGVWGGVDWLLLSAAVGLGWIGSYWWTGLHPQWWKGFPFQLASLWFLWKAFPSSQFPLREGSSSVQEAIPPPMAPSAPHQELPWLLVMAFFAWAGQYFFLARRVGLGLFCWAGALAIFWTILPGSKAASPAPSGKADRVWVLLILIAAALMRFPFLDQHFTGLQIDEGLCITDGHDYSAGRMTSPFITTNWGANASFHFWWLGHYMRVFGETVPAARGFSALVSLGVLWVFYLWCRLYFGRWASAGACFLMSCGWWFLFYSLSPFQNILVVFWEMLAFYYFGKALRDGEKWDYFRGGLFLAMMEMEYLPGRVGIGMFGLAVLGIFLVEGRPFLKKHALGLSLAFFSMLWLAGPFLRYFAGNLETVMGRTKQLSLMAEVARTGDYFLLLEKWFWTFLSFLHNNPGFDLRFCAQAPMIDPWSGALFVLGLFLALFNLKRRAAWVLLSGLFFGMMTNALAIQGQNPDPTYVNGQRYFLVTPFLYMAAAWTLDWSFQFLRGQKEWARKGISALVLLAVAWSFTWNARVYYKSFQDFKKNDSYFGNLGFNHIQVAEYLNENRLRYHLVVDHEYHSAVVVALTKDKTPYTVLGHDWKVPFEKAVTKDVLILVLRWSYLDLQEKIRKHYPNAQWGWLKDPKGQEHLATVLIRKEDIQALQSGRTAGDPLH